MVKVKSNFVWTALIAAALMVSAAAVAFAAKQGESEVIVRRVDSNNLIRLRVYIDGKNAGSLKVGQTSTFRVRNGDHTIYVGFEDYQARSTEVSQFTTVNERFIFSITDTSIVLVRQESIVAPVRVVKAAPKKKKKGADDDDDAPVAPVTEDTLANREVETYVNTVQQAFNTATEKIKKGAKITIINVDSDVLAEADFVLEELTFMANHSKKNFVVIDRRKVESYRAANHQPLTRYENDYLISLGELLGANYVVTGRLNGDGAFRRLRIRVLDVRTGVLVGSASSPI